MAVTAFDQPAQAQFNNTYIPIPFQEILAAGQSKQGKYDDNRRGFEQMSEEANNLRAIPQSVDEKYIQNTVVPTMQEVADEFSTLDYGDSEVIRQINSKLRENIDRRLVSKIQDSYNKWSDAQNIKSKMLASGKTPFKPFDYREYDTSSDGVYTETPRATLDYEGSLQNFFSKVGEEYLGERQLSSGRIGSFHGRSAAKLKSYLKDNFDVAASDPAIQQLLESKGVDPSNKKAVEEVLLKESQRFETSRMSNSYDAGSGSDDSSFGYNSPIGHTLRTQPTGFTGKSFKDVQRQTEDYERTRDDLEAKSRMAMNNGQINIARNLESQMKELDDINSPALYWKEQLNNNILPKFTESILNNVDGFKSSIKDIVTDSNALNKWAQSYSAAINKNIETEGFKNINLASEVNKEYVKLFGLDDDYVKWDKSKGYKQSKLSVAINKSIDDAKSINGRIDSMRNSEWETFRKQGLIEETVAMPIVENSTDYNKFPEWRTMVNLMRTAPEDFKIDIVSSDNVKSKDKSKLIDEFNKADEINLISASEADITSPFIYVTTSKKTDKGTERSDVGYKIRIDNPNQYQAIAETFFRKGDYLNGSKWLDPKISKSIENSFKDGQVPSSVNINILGQPLQYQLMDDGYYLISNGEKINTEPLRTKDEIKSNAYSILLSNSNIN